jgi:long-subunit acyl-CoA synthetase (AMP-forming)
VKVAALAKTKGLLYGGAPLAKAVGDFLTEKGVDVYNTYGA